MAVQSEYLQKVLVENNIVGARYLEKIKLVDNLDPYTIQDVDLNFSLDSVPPISAIDITTYLVLTHSFYTGLQMKAYKSLRAYKYFEAGFVQKVGTYVVKDFAILVGKVKHSQRANEKCLEVWVIIQKNGSVCTAHCTCMAGASEVCSHVGAILYAAEYASNMKQNISCTDIKAAWPVPSSCKVPTIPVKDMVWGTAPRTLEHDRLQVPSLDAGGIVDFLTEVKKEGCSSALMRIVEPFASNIASSVETLNIRAVFDVYNESYSTKTHVELQMIAKLMNFKITDEEKDSIEEQTRTQSQSHEWFRQRAGRITASRFKQAVRTKIESPSLSLIKAVCYPTKMKFSTKAMNWGLTNEKLAIETYYNNICGDHTELQIIEVGLLLNNKYPQFGVTPDSLVYCECCAGGCVEVKCPYSLHTQNIDSIEEYAKMKTSCLDFTDNKITLNKNHAYYFQVQMQIHVSELLYCDFVVWSPKVLFIQRIYPNEEFFNANAESALQFHSKVIMPELLSRYFTRKEGGARILTWCSCIGVADGRPMIQCENSDCEIQWFHFECVHLSEVPQDPWYCSSCH